MPICEATKSQGL